MMEYQVPQFIEVENKIVGPLTLSQFIYLAGAAGISVVSFLYLPLIAAIIISAAAVGLAVALSFYKMNGKPFIEILEAGFGYYTGARFFLWRHEDAPAPKKQPQRKTPAMAAAEEPRRAPALTRGRLSELAWSLDVQNAIPDSRTPSP